MIKKLKKQCQVCEKLFNIEELYPIALIRDNALAAAKKEYPALTADGLICFPDLRKIHALHFEEILRKEKGVLSELEEEVLQSLKRHELLSENINEEFEEALSFGERVADKMAGFGGSWTFLSLFALVMFLWMGVNSFQLFKEPFDPYPYILLNLFLSCLAAIQAPIIMMSQNRQASRDRLSQENDYQINLKSELQIRQLNARLELFMRHHWEKMHDLSRAQQDVLQEIEKIKENSRRGKE